MSLNKINSESCFVDSYMVFTPAGQAKMAALRFTQQELAKVEAAAREGILLIADAAITRAMASSKDLSTPVRQPFINGRPSPGVRLAYLFRRARESDGRPIVILNRARGRAYLLGEVPGSGPAFSHEELLRICSLMQSYRIDEQPDAYCRDRDSSIVIYNLRDTPAIVTLAVQMARVMADVRVARTKATARGADPEAGRVEVDGETAERMEAIVAAGTFMTEDGNQVIRADSIEAAIVEFVGGLRRRGLDDRAILHDIRERITAMRANSPGDAEIVDLVEFIDQFAMSLLGQPCATRPGPPDRSAVTSSVHVFADGELLSNRITDSAAGADDRGAGRLSVDREPTNHQQELIHE